MSSEKTINDIVEENANYVLGMYDLYQNDQEIVEALKLKNLSEDIIQKVLRQIKKPSYEKRIVQARRSFIISGALASLFILIALLLKNIPGAQDILKGDRTGEGMLIWIFKLYSNIYFYVLLLLILQMIYSSVSFFKYRNLLKEG